MVAKMLASGGLPLLRRVERARLFDQKPGKIVDEHVKPSNRKRTQIVHCSPSNGNKEHKADRHNDGSSSQERDLLEGQAVLKQIRQEV